MQTQHIPHPVGGLETLARMDSGESKSVVSRPAFAWKTRIALPAVLLITVLALLAYTGRDALYSAVEVRVVPVVVRAGTESPASGASIVQAAGWLEADPYPVAVTALTDGVVKEVLVLEGQRVRANDIVARLVDEDAVLALTRAEADLAERQAELTAAQRNWDHPIELDRKVATADSIVAEAKADLLRTDADVRTESARVEELADQFVRLEKSYQAQASSEIEFVGAKLKLQTQKATLEAAQARRPVLEAQLRQHEADLKAARDERELRIEQSRALDVAKAVVATSSAARDEAKLRLARTEIRATADGIVLDRLVGPGSRLMFASDLADSATVVKLFDPNHLQVRVDVPLADAAKVDVGMEAEIVVGVLPNESFAGVVTRIVQAADVSKNTLQVKVAIKNPAAALKPEMLARVRFLAKRPSTTATAGGAGQLLFAPDALIQKDGENVFAWTVDRAGESARRVKIQLGSKHQDGWTSIVSGLRAGDQLIADVSEVKEGSRVRVVGEAPIPPGGEHGVH